MGWGGVAALASPEREEFEEGEEEESAKADSDSGTVGVGNVIHQEMGHTGKQNKNSRQYTFNFSLH